LASMKVMLDMVGRGIWEGRRREGFSASDEAAAPPTENGAGAAELRQRGVNAAGYCTARSSTSGLRKVDEGIQASWSATRA
jgi:hypothetical protein